MIHLTVMFIEVILRFCLIFMVYIRSTFSNIFDEPHFIKSLQEDVRIVKEIPKELEPLPRARKHFSSWASMSYYEDMAGLWKEYKASYLHLSFISLLGDSILKSISFTNTIMKSRDFSVTWCY